MKTRNRHQRAAWLCGLATLLIAACVSSRETPGLGGESHFLRRCGDQCGSGLDCIQNVCTRGCVVGKDSCSDLVRDAVCTAGSIEPGEVAVCDFSCARDPDCAALSTGHHCEGGFCRAPAASAAVDAGSSGSKGDAGSAGFPYPTDKVFACPTQVDTDPITVLRSIVQDDVLLLRVGHGGGCKQHAYAVCFDEGFRESYPVQTTLRVIHEDNGDTCEAYLMPELRVDLKPLAQTYERYYQSSAGLISTNFGMYAFGALSCDDRELGASGQVESYDRQVSRECQTTADCRWASIDTRCTARCGTVASNQGAEELSDWLAVTSMAVCGDYDADGCGPLLIPPCAPPSGVACVSGKCEAMR